MTTYFRIQPADRPNILDPENQTSTSWNDLGDDDRIRRGVSVMWDRDDLAEYLAQSGIPFTSDWELLEVEGYLADDEDEDADMGVDLIIPTAIVSRELLSDGFEDEILAAADRIFADA